MALAQAILYDVCSAPGLLSSLRFNKLGLDKIATEEEPPLEGQVEEAPTFTCVQSVPLNQEPVVCADIGTAHSAAVTGEEVALGYRRDANLCWGGNGG